MGCGVSRFMIRVFFKFFFNRNEIHFTYRASFSLFEVYFFTFTFHWAIIDGGRGYPILRFYDSFFRCTGIFESVFSCF